MSLDLYQDEAAQSLSNMRPITAPDPSAFDGFVRGAGMYAMRGFAETARAVDLLGAIGPILQDRISGGTSSFNPWRISDGTEAQDRYFREHEAVFQSAVDYWTPRPNEVGVAGEVVGSLLSKLPKIIVSPGLAVGETLLSRGEELVQKGVPAGKAGAAGAVEAAGLGLGIWMPILGGNLWQRVFVGGAGFNALQGVTSRGAQELILKGTPAANEIHAFDGEALTLDALLGLAFGSLAHVSPKQRAQGEAAWGRIKDWAERLSPAEKDAVATLREAQHLNVDSTPGTPEAPRDVQAHVERVKAALEQLATGEEVQVEDQPLPRFAPDPARWAEAQTNGEAILHEAQKLEKTLDLTSEPGAQKGGSDIAPTGWTGVPSIESLLKMAGVDVNEPEPGRVRPEGPQAPKPGGGTSSSSQPPAAEPARPSADPIAVEAQRVAAAAPDFALRIGTDSDGKPVTKTVGKFLEEARAKAADARQRSGLFEVAAGCLFGKA
jgi:hypothetical protein